VRIPGPSWVENRMMLNIRPSGTGTGMVLNPLAKVV
jgi:hypothetical protein